MKIDVTNIQRITNLIFQKYIETNGNSIYTNEDNFWFIDMDEAVDLLKEPTVMCVSSLEDDYNSLTEILESERVINILDIDRVANIFRIMSYEVSKQENKLM